MMRRFLFICCLLFALLPVSASGIDFKEQLDLMGEIADTDPITSEERKEEQGVVVFKSAESIDIRFSVKSSVNVKVSDMSGNVIHEDVQNAIQRKGLMLDTSDWGSSVYKIEFENLDNHKVAYGYVIL